MNVADNADSSKFVHLDQKLPKLTKEAVERALMDFPLPLMSGKDMDWLAMAVRRSLAISIPNTSDSSARTSNVDVRAELERLADLAGSTWVELFECDDAADSRLWEYAFHLWGSKGEIDIASPPDYRRFEAAVAELDWLASFMQQASKATKRQPGPWRQSEQKQLRVKRGQFLAPVYEAAFGKKVSANNHPSDARHEKPTPFMDFYSHMVTQAFGQQETSNLADVVKASCQRHRRCPVKIADGIIPNL